ncbi:MAG: hypothetical protein ACM3JG_14780 [Thiohalocapsa sp.]
MRRPLPLVALLLLLAPLLVEPGAFGQTEPPGAASATLAVGQLPSVIDMPLFLRLYRAAVPAGREATYEGSSLLLYALAGQLTLTDDVSGGGGEAHTLATGAGAFIPAGHIVRLRAGSAQPAELLLFVLTARPNQRRPLLDRPVVVRELFRTPEPLPGLQPGPYELTLSRVTLPLSGSPSPAYWRSGAALDYVLAGTATLAAATGGSETAAAGAPLFERFGWVHRLTNAGGAPLVLLQANLSQEGAQAVQRVAEK